MHCPFCGGRDTRVVDSRLSTEGDQVRRRRECVACGERFTTYESAELSLPQVIKSDGRREPFDRGKLLEKIQLSCYKTTVSADQIEEVVDSIETDLGNLAEKEVGSKQVGELVMERLRHLNEVAYVRFASVYRQFKDKRDFMRELEQMTN